MKPTKAPDGMVEGMYDNYGYEDYDEDDFFYHMYFDEVSTTPIPSEFYDLLESVSNGGNTGFSYPDYFDYGLKFRNASDSDSTTLPSARQSKNTRYLSFKSDSSQRRNSKYLKIVESDARNKTSKSYDSDDVIRSRSKRSSKRRKSSRARGKKLKAGFRKRKQIQPGVIGILDRRIPLFFRQSPFVTIALTKFVVLSTGVTTGKNDLILRARPGEWQ